MSQLCVVIAPSGFKESLSPEQAAAAIAEGVRRAAPEARIVEVPLVDGGEGFTETLVRATRGQMRKVKVTGPVGDEVDSYFGIIDKKNIHTDESKGTPQHVAVLEMAAAAGLRLVPKERRDPLLTTTRGVGELIKFALDEEVERILLGCGDSGTTDGGAGAAASLGVKLLKADGSSIGDGAAALDELHAIDIGERDQRLNDVRIDVACNIHNILCGEQGVARVFGPQKGASEETVAKMEGALERYAEIIKRDTGKDVRLMPGGGASGGLGAGLHALLGAELHQRYEVVMEYLEIDEILKNADLVFTSEGGIDFQTSRGKIPVEVATRAKRLGLPVIAIAGTIGKGADLNFEQGIDAMFSMLPKPCTLEEAIAEAHPMLAKCAENVMRTVMLSMSIADKRKH
ncbi:MAG TPA: glycerate kinase [Pyrinomonadaceae bacterium]|nr:glycerate kinase [Pyrinomonadaceae bacterium]